MDRPRVVVLADDLIWQTRLVAAVSAAGAEPIRARSTTALAGSPAGIAAAVVDLTARAYDPIAAIGAARAAGARVLAVGQHDDHALRKRALAAGAERVWAYRKLHEDPASFGRWLADGDASPAT